MSTFQADLKGNQTTGYNIEITNNQAIIAQIPVSSLYLNNGNSVNNINEFENDQQKVNYLDSVKDGANVFTMQGLNIYPKAEFGGYPTFPVDLKNFEKNLLQARNSYLEHTTWLKVKKGSVLDKGKNYSKCLWESGLGYSVFLSNPDNVKTVKTFGSYIDPLEKQNADEVWPPRGSSISLTKNFMKIMGFGEHSFLNAKTTSSTTFEYIMNIGCGNECGASPNQCSITHIGDNNNASTPSEVYFSGNNQKKQFLKSNASTKQKVKFIVVKEWGDKTQVLIYLIYYYFLKGRETVIMTTCDMVVFMLCLNLSIPCIYTGAYSPPGLKLEAGKKHYSILEFKPSNTPFTDAYNRLNEKISSVIAENESFITAIRNLTTDTGSNTRISVGTNMLTFSKEFYEKILEDLNSIQSSLQIKGQELINKYSRLNETTGKLMIPEIESEIKNIQSKYIIVPFLKIKKGMTPNILTILMTKSYTAEKPVDNSKPAIKNFLMSRGMDEKQADKEAKRSFYEIASSASNGFLASRTGGQSGGSLDAQQINLFPVDEDNLAAYVYHTNGEIENDNLVFSDPLSNSPLFNPAVSADVEDLNLLTILNDSFTQTFDKFAPTNPIYKTDNFKDSIYTLFVYESYINGFGNVVFDNNDLRRIINDYKLMTDDSMVQNVNAIAEGIKRPQGFKQGLNMEKIRQQRAEKTSKLQHMKRASQYNIARGIEPWMSPNMQQGITVGNYGGVSLKKRKVIKRKTMHKRKNRKVTKKGMKKRNTRRNKK